MSCNGKAGQKRSKEEVSHSHCMIHFVLCGHFFYVSKLAGAFRYSRNLSGNVNKEKLTDVTEATVQVTDECGSSWPWDDVNSVSLVMATTGGCVLKLAGPCARAVLSKSCFPSATTVLGHKSVSVRWHKAPQDEFRTGMVTKSWITCADIPYWHLGLVPLLVRLVRSRKATSYRPL